MTHPIRLQRSRLRGFNLQALSLATNGLPAVNVARPGKWGNPFVVRPAEPVGYFVCRGKVDISVKTAEDAVARFEEFIAAKGTKSDALRDSLSELRGKNLACFCKLDAHCHADTLLRLANKCEGM